MGVNTENEERRNAFANQIGSFELARSYSPYSKVDKPDEDASYREVYFHELAETVSWLCARLQEAHQRIDELEDSVENSKNGDTA